MTILFMQYCHKVFSFNTMGKEIIVNEINTTTSAPDAKEIVNILNQNNIGYNLIDQVNWPGFDYNADVKFRIAYSDINKEIYLEYLVKEDDIKAIYSEDKQAPYKESCVEFFSIPGNDGIYYNLEMSCIGKGTFAGGATRAERTRYDNDILNKIRRYPSLGSDTFGIKTLEENGGKQYEWSLVLAIPYDIFTLSTVNKLKGETIRANFYKCGDDMPNKHYISWNPIRIPKPNFHTPDHFGELKFQ